MSTRLAPRRGFFDGPPPLSFPSPGARPRSMQYAVGQTLGEAVLETLVGALDDGQAAGALPKLRRMAWFMVWMAMLGTMCCSTSVILINVGVFMKPLAGALAWSRGDISLALSVGARSLALAHPFVGRLVD